MHTTISLERILLHTGKFRFCRCIHHPKLAGLQHLWCIVGKGQRCSLPENQLSEANHLARAGSSKVGQYCSETAMRGLCLKEALLLAAAIAISSVLAHHLKPFSGL
jgi:hypothetical protein